MSEVTAAVVEEDLASGDWEPWLRERFVAYLMRDATGGTRPPAEVGRALARLSGQPDALTRLASLAFLLDPDARVGAWLRDDVPGYLRRIRVRSEVHRDQRRNSPRGRIDWARTQALQSATQDDTWFASRTVMRTLDTPELITVRWALDRVRLAAMPFVAAADALRTGWTAELAESAAACASAASHSALREVPVRAPTHAERAKAHASPDPAVRRAAEILVIHDGLWPEPSMTALRDAISRCALMAVDVNIRFQVFAMLAVVECVERLVQGARRVDRMIAPHREEIVRWEGPDLVVKLHYDQGAASGAHSDVMHHYFGTTQHLRPDIRLVMVRGGVTTELIADAKRSLTASYLADAHHKMRGYIADRPDAFARARPQAIVICPVRRVGRPRDNDDVVFASADAGESGGLADAITRWWGIGA